jgi:hypothetical protein
MGDYAGVDRAAEKRDVLMADEAGELLVAASLRAMRRGCGRCAVSCCG